MGDITTRIGDEWGLADGLLGRLDPRLKLILLLLLIMSIFSASGFLRLGLLALLPLPLIILRPKILRTFLCRLVYLRWLLLFTLFFHLFLTPGRTLLGMRLLSYDGLLRGVMVDVQLMLALFFTLLFALSTRAVTVAGTMVQLLRPLQKIGINITAGGELIALVLQFLPRVFAEGNSLAQKTRRRDGLSLSARLEALTLTLGNSLVCLVNQADETARDIARGNRPVLEDGSRHVWSRYDILGLIVGLLVLTLSWRV